MSTVTLPPFAGNRLLSWNETQRFLGVSRMTLWKFTFDKDPDERLPSYKIGKSRKFKYDDIVYWLENHKT